MKEILVGLLATVCGIGFIWGIGRLFMGKHRSDDDTHPFVMGVITMILFTFFASVLYVIGSLIILEFK